MASPPKKRETAAGPRYDVRYRDPSGRQVSRTFKRKSDAVAFHRTVEADILRGDWVDPRKGRLTLDDWWQQWWPTVVNLRESSRARDESYYRTHVLPTFGTTRIDAIDHAMVAAWVARMDSTDLAPATVVKAAQTLSKTLTAAVNAGLIRANPATRVDLPHIEREEMRFLTPGEVVQLADAIDPRYRAFVVVGAYCGLRFGELAGLRRELVDLTAGRIRVAEIATEVRGKLLTGPPKTRAGTRTVPMPRVAVDALTAHLDATDDPYVFPAPQGGPLRGGLFRSRVWHPATRSAGLEGVRIHDLRHTAVALWIAAGASANEVKVRAGHTSVVTVLDRYGHLLPGQEERVNDALDAMADAASV